MLLGSYVVIALLVQCLSQMADSRTCVQTVGMQVLDLLDDACSGLLAHIQARQQAEA